MLDNFGSAPTAADMKKGNQMAEPNVGLPLQNRTAAMKVGIERGRRKQGIPYKLVCSKDLAGSSTGINENGPGLAGFLEAAKEGIVGARGNGRKNRTIAVKLHGDDAVGMKRFPFFR